MQLPAVLSTPVRRSVGEGEQERAAPGRGGGEDGGAGEILAGTGEISRISSSHFLDILLHLLDPLCHLQMRNMNERLRRDEEEASVGGAGGRGVQRRFWCAGGAG